MNTFYCYRSGSMLDPNLIRKTIESLSATVLDLDPTLHDKILFSSPPPSPLHRCLHWPLTSSAMDDNAKEIKLEEKNKTTAEKPEMSFNRRRSHFLAITMGVGACDAFGMCIMRSWKPTTRALILPHRMLRINKGASFPLVLIWFLSLVWLISYMID